MGEKLNLYTWRSANILLGRTLAAKVLTRLVGQATNKFGIQFQTDDGEVLHYNREIKPKSWKSIHVLKRDFLEQLRADNPGGLGILRLYPNTEGWDTNPKVAAEEHIKRIEHEAGHVLDLFDAIEDNNEYVFPAPHSTKEQQEAADIYMMHLIELCTQDLGKKPVVLNASTGNWSWDIIVFMRMLLALREYGGYLGFHEYDWPTLWRAHEEGVARGDGGMWHTLRWKRAATAIREWSAGWCPDFIITEFGLERAVLGLGHAGWRMTHENLDQAIENYIQSLAWYYQQLDEDVHSADFFGCGMVAPWDGWGFDIKGVTPLYEAIKSFPTVVPPSPPLPEPPPPEEPEEPEEPNGGEQMDIKVFDMHRNPQTWDWATAKYGVAFRRAEVASGQKVYRLIELWEKTGHSSLITQVVDEQGQPMPKVDVAFYWPDAPDPPDPPTTVYAHDWHRNFVHGPTNINGDIGPGMGQGAYHGEGEGGPHAVWVRDPNIPSDICEKLGMLAGTFHDHFDQKFQLVIAGEGPAPEPPGGEKMFVLVGTPTFSVAAKNQVVITVTGERNFYDVRASIGVKGTTVDMGPFEPVTLKKFKLDMTYDPGTGEVERTFTVVLEHPDGTLLGGPYEFPYTTGELGVWNAQVQWDEGVPESPAPEPPEGGVVDTLRRKAARLRQDAADLDAAAASLERAKQLSEELADVSEELADVL